MGEISCVVFFLKYCGDVLYIVIVIEWMLVGKIEVI